MKIGKRFITIFLLWASITCSFSCGSKEESSTHSESIKFKQYYIQGQQLFTEHCSNCHQKSGKGLGLLFPPLDQSDYVDQNHEEVLCLIRNGMKGEIIVNGNEYNKEMPGIPSLTDLEIAEISTYLYNTWGREKGIIEVKDATAILQKCNQ